MSLLLALLLSTANAGFWSDLCAKHLIAEDPYQFESASPEWLAREHSRLSIRQAWNTATPDEVRMIRIIEAELERRAKREGWSK